METIKIETLTSDKSKVVGICLFANDTISKFQPAVMIDNNEHKTTVIANMYRGDYNIIRTQLHKLVDDLIDILME